MDMNKNAGLRWLLYSEPEVAAQLKHLQVWYSLLLRSKCCLSDGRIEKAFTQQSHPVRAVIGRPRGERRSWKEPGFWSSLLSYFLLGICRQVKRVSPWCVLSRSWTTMELRWIRPIGLWYTQSFIRGFWSSRRIIGRMLVFRMLPKDTSTCGLEKQGLNCRSSN